MIAAWPPRPNRLAWIAFALAVLLVLPSLGFGFFADDVLQIAELEKWSANPAGPFDLYAFIPHDRALVQRLHQAGFLPYFAPPGLQIAFWRPLASALIALDHALFGRAAFAYHLHALLWYAALLLLAMTILRRVLSPALAGLATLVFCLDGAHVMAAVWIAARNGAVACFFGFLAFAVHRRWRVDGWRAGAWVAPIAAALALLAGEMGIAALAYLLASELIEDRPGRWRALAPVAGLLALYLALYPATGAGVHQSGAYLDPFGDPAGFLLALPHRIGLLAGSLLVAAPIDLAAIDGRPTYVLEVVGGAGALLVVFWLRSALRRLPIDEARTVRTFAWAAAAALVVGTPGLPGARVLLAASLGASVVIATLLRDAWMVLRAHRFSRRSGGLALAGLIALGAPNVALAPLAYAGNVVFLGKAFSRARQMARDAEIVAPVPARVVIVAFSDILSLSLQVSRALEQGLSPEELRAVVAAFPRAGAGLPLPDRFGYRGATVLSLSPARHVLRRIAKDTLELSTPNGTLLDGLWTTLLRAPSLPLPRGTRIALDGFVATVMEDHDGKPTRVAFQFDRPLEDPSLVFLALVDGRLHRLSLPDIDEEIAVTGRRTSKEGQHARSW